MPLDPNYELPKPEQIPPMPDDTYQVVVKDISETEGKDFNTGEPMKQLEFSFQVLDEGEFRGRILKKWVTPKYAPKKDNRSESNLHAIITKVLKKEPAPDEIHLHELIGKQLRVVVSTYTSNAGYERNKIETYLPTKEELPLVTQEELEGKEPIIAGKEESKNKLVTANTNDNENGFDELAKKDEGIDIDDIPF